MDESLPHKWPHILAVEGRTPTAPHARPCAGGGAHRTWRRRRRRLLPDFLRRHVSHGTPGEFDKIVKRGLKEPFDIAMRAVIDVVALGACRPDAVGLDALGTQLRH